MDVRNSCQDRLGMNEEKVERRYIAVPRGAAWVGLGAASRQKPPASRPSDRTSRHCQALQLTDWTRNSWFSTHMYFPPKFQEWGYETSFFLHTSIAATIYQEIWQESRSFLYLSSESFDSLSRGCRVVMHLAAKVICYSAFFLFLHMSDFLFPTVKQQKYNMKPIFLYLSLVFHFHVVWLLCRGAPARFFFGSKKCRIRTYKIQDYVLPLYFPYPLLFLFPLHFEKEMRKKKEENEGLNVEYMETNIFCSGCYFRQS